MTTADPTRPHDSVASEPAYRYDGPLAGRIEARWQAFWAEHGTFHTPNPVGDLGPGHDYDACQAGVDRARADAPKFYVLDMFAGPSGSLHVGHPLGYVATDVYGRYLRMRGHNVLHAFGFDAFGLPAEQYAVQTGRHPRETTEANITTIRRQLRRLGLAHDDRRSVSTTDVDFYRWTQWMFLQIHGAWYDDEQRRARPIAELEKEFAAGRRAVPRGRDWHAMAAHERREVLDSYRLAYLADVPVNWCPGLGTVLADEEVTAEGRSERGNYPVFARTMRQWMLRITAYADRLVDDLDVLDWPEPIKAQQRNWIGRSREQGEATYRLHDWLFSRQRYWGEPFPIVYDEHGPVALPESMLPVVLPQTPEYAPITFDPDDASSEPVAPLGRLTDWVEVTLDLGDGPRTYRRETNTMPQWAGSCWYELRYLDPRNDEHFCDPALERHWLGSRGGTDPGGVDLYVGGVEHAVLHLLYARFWHKVLYDLGHVSSREPFRRLVNNGYIQAYSYTDERGVYVPAAEVVERDGTFWWRDRPVTRSLGKMGKSLRNMVTPDELCERYGADTFRVYVMASGPLQASRPWDPRGIVGAQRFLQRVWRSLVDEETGATRVVDEPAGEETLRLLHLTIAGVRDDLDALSFHTAVARLTRLSRHVAGLAGEVPAEVARPMVLMLAPFAPHLAEELWQRLGAEQATPRQAGSLAYLPFSEADPAYLGARTVTCVVQVSGKLRGRMDVPPDITADELRQRALDIEPVRRALRGRAVSRVVVRPPGLVNIVPAE
ncbi:class I tRNA ligase family protein [Actinopolymorpha sp. NPDC004070]|uniref:class I tRNA ligase family protein n=1 Tax=Actinopolymorpha sp. NPDC004070 TaxID=3154548 RepID=UPI0033B95631